MIAIYLLVLLGLGVYSYSQIDLNLTLFQFPQFLAFQKAMIQLGYFNRPLSTAIYLLLIFLLFAFYIFFLQKTNRLSVRNFYLIIGGICVLGLLSYPAFSYDFFNYLFDIRIFTHYGLNPYLFKPLDFTGDPWLRFMHWVHRPYPYGPVWLVITYLPSVAGLGKFVLTALNFKVLFVAFYLGNIYLIKKILLKVSPQRVQSAVVFFALNPLVIIETVVSPHIDSVMTFFLLLSTYFFISNRRLPAIVSLLVSAGVKFLTLLILPLYLVKRQPFDKSIKLMLLISLLALIPVIWQREFYPWYFLPAFTLLALIPQNHKILTIGIAFILGLLLQYAPFLYVGSYPIPVQQAKSILVFLPAVLACLVLYGRQIFKNS